MNTSRAFAIIISILIVIAITLGVFRLTTSRIVPESSTPIMTFEDCVKGGGTVIPGTSPARCQAPGGPLFVQEALPTKMPPPVPQASASSTDVSDLIHIFSPVPEMLVTSPIDVAGEARGNWFFEASFPMKLVDANGTLLARQPVLALGDWMTTDFVPFRISLAFKSGSATSGTLIFQKDNPSGLQENDAEIRIPVKFR